MSNAPETDRQAQRNICESAPSDYSYLNNKKWEPKLPSVFLELLPLSGLSVFATTCHKAQQVLVLAGIPAAAQFIARGPEGGVEVGFLDGHVIYFVACSAG